MVVSTDDHEISAISRQRGAEVILRPVKISTDISSSELALLHALKDLHENEGYSPDLLVFLQCTSPLTLPEDIDGAVQALFDQEADSSLAVTPLHYFLYRRDHNGDAIGVNHDKRVRPLRQERDLQYLETGAVYVMRTKGFIWRPGTVFSVKLQCM